MMLDQVDQILKINQFVGFVMLRKMDIHHLIAACFAQFSMEQKAFQASVHHVIMAAVAVLRFGNYNKIAALLCTDPGDWVWFCSKFEA